MYLWLIFFFIDIKLGCFFIGMVYLGNRIVNESSREVLCYQRRSSGLRLGA